MICISVFSSPTIRVRSQLELSHCIHRCQHRRKLEMRKRDFAHPKPNRSGTFSSSLQNNYTNTRRPPRIQNAAVVTEAEAQAKPVDYATSTLHLTNSKSTRGIDATVNTVPAMTAGLPQSSVGMLQASSPATSMAPILQVDSGKIRMKPRQNHRGRPRLSRRRDGRRGSRPPRTATAEQTA